MQIEKIIAIFGVANTNKLLAHYETQPIRDLAIHTLTSVPLEELTPLLAKLLEQDPPKKFMPAIWMNVESSNIKAVRYDEAREILDIQFLSGDDYFFRYEHFPYFEYEQFIEAGSIGSYYARHIKGQYESEKLTSDGE